MSLLFGDQSWPNLKEHIEKQSLLLLPIGQTEEHGPHLPVDTDARIAEAYGQRLAQALAPELPVLLMDTICYGYTMKLMQKWPGTIVVRSRVIMDYVSDVCRSVLDMGFSKLAILDCHGHHAGALSTVSRELCDACDKAIAIVRPMRMSREVYNAVRKSERGGSSHSGEWETSLVLHISPEVVDMARAHDNDRIHYHSEFVAGDGLMGSQQVTWSTWYIESSETGILGTPTLASAETGRAIMDAAVKNGVSFLKEYWAKK